MQAFYDDVRMVHLVSEVPLTEKVLYKGETLEVTNVEASQLGWVYTVKTPILPLGETVRFEIGKERVRVVPRMIVKREWFEDNYSDHNAKLGSWVSDNKTHFAVWAPTATSVFLKVNETLYDMTRSEKGVYTKVFDANLHGETYHYIVYMNGDVHSTTDPYAKASRLNRAGSVVVDFDQLNLDICPHTSDEPPVILEVHTRDFSMDPTVDFKHKGQFLGLIESVGDYGMKHVVDLGVTHIQLMPISDFETVDEENPLTRYNWGYDTMQYMALEGSYTSDKTNPFQVIEDFAQVVSAYHKEKIGVNLDMVFNHVFNQETHPLHILVPYYYFRYTDTYELSDGSFCGNELATEMKMCRKLVLDTCAYFVDTFNVDGFRFDLMGLMDVDTVNLIKEMNPEIMVYGEGWKMPTVLPEDKHASMDNQEKMPEIGFFNDVFRNLMGGSIDGRDLGFAGGREVQLDHVLASICGNSDPAYRPAIFSKASQSINYVECHDNLTVADRVKLNRKTEKEALYMLGFVLASQGIPFIQIGQSFFRDKQGDYNSYQSPDAINHVPWSYLDMYSEMNRTVKKWIKIHKLAYRIQEGYHFKDDAHILDYTYGMTTWRFDNLEKRVDLLKK